MKKIACLLLLLAASNALADRLYYSHDIITNIHADYIDGAYNKLKLVWGEDGTAHDVSLLNPWPIQGTVTVVQGGSLPWSVFDSQVDSDLISFRTANHTDLTLIDLDLLTFKSSNHTDLGTINTSVGTVNTNLLSFKSANHTDLTQVDTDLLAFKSANHTDLTAINSKSVVFHVRNDYSSVNVTTAAYTQLVASTTSPITQIYIFDSSGQTLVLATGAAGLEVDQIYIAPGGDELLNFAIAAGTRISIKAVSATANAGEIDINAFN